jgi:hypothetical protein
VTVVDFKWRQRGTRRFNSDGRLGFFRAHEYWLIDIYVHYPPDEANLWLANASEALPPGEVLFAKHSFILNKGDGDDDPCMNFDAVLKTYEIVANGLYDTDGSLESQRFSFDYQGDKSSSSDKCARIWPQPQDLSTLGRLPAKAVSGRLGFPSGLLNDLGFGLLTSQSLLGTGRTEETGASLYVGVGPPGNTSFKELTVGLKGGVNFTKSEGDATLVDVTGDGIDDIVYRDDDGKIKYCAGVRDADGDHRIAYPTDRCGTIEGISNFSIFSTATRSAGVDSYGPLGTFAGTGYNGSKSDSYVYFTDVDGDGLIDLVFYGQVFYGQGEDRTGGRNIVRVSPNSALSPHSPDEAAILSALTDVRG